MRKSYVTHTYTVEAMKIRPYCQFYRVCVSNNLKGLLNIQGLLNLIKNLKQHATSCSVLLTYRDLH